MTKAVIFDMDGVIFDTETYLCKYWCQAANEFGFPMKREDALELRSLARKFAAPHLKEKFGDSFDYLAVRARRMELMREYFADNPMEKKRGIERLLEYLKKEKITTALATATDYERASEYLKRGNLFEYFDKIVCATMVESGKPMPDIYLYAAKQTGFAPSDCIAIEDSPNGVLSASRAGCRVIMVPDLTEPDSELSALLYARCDSLDEVIGIIENEKNNGQG